MKFVAKKRHICFEDNHLLVVNKPAGLLSQGDKTGDQVVADIWSAYIKKRDDKPGNVFLHPAHRLDRPVSGCIILCKTSKSLTRMTTMFRNREIDKRYIGISMPKKAFEWHASKLTIEGFIHKDKRKNQVVHKSKPFPGGQPSTTKVGWLVMTKDLHVMECRPITGRPHQIRVQLASIGLPLYGDLKYGGPPTEDQRLYLHCYEMSFLHPVRKEPTVVKADFDSSPLWDKVPKL